MEPEHGSNVIVRCDGEIEALLRQLIIEGNRRLLMATNQDWPGPRLVEITGNASIVGVVVGKWVPEVWLDQ